MLDPLCPNDNSLVVYPTWLRPGDKQLPEPINTQFIDAYMRRPALKS